jgi:hypothetical protein
MSTVGAGILVGGHFGNVGIWKGPPGFGERVSKLQDPNAKLQRNPTEQNTMKTLVIEV